MSPNWNGIPTKYKPAMLAAAALRDRGGFRNGKTDEQAAAFIWSMGNPAAYRTLVIAGGWSTKAHQTWLHAGLNLLA